MAVDSESINNHINFFLTVWAWTCAIARAQYNVLHIMHLPCTHLYAYTSSILLYMNREIRVALTMPVWSATAVWNVRYGRDGKMTQQRECGGLSTWKCVFFQHEVRRQTSATVAFFTKTRTLLFIEHLCMCGNVYGCMSVKNPVSICLGVCCVVLRQIKV